MPSDSWVLKAIEREAMRRAYAQIESQGPMVGTLFGLSFGQIAWLIAEYRNRGKNPEQIVSTGTLEEQP